MNWMRVIQLLESDAEIWRGHPDAAIAIGAVCAALRHALFEAEQEQKVRPSGHPMSVDYGKGFGYKADHDLLAQLIEAHIRKKLENLLNDDWLDGPYPFSDTMMNTGWLRAMEYLRKKAGLDK